MSINIVLQTNLSEPQRVDKDLTDVTTLAATLRDDTSIQDPVLLVEADLADLAAVNYLTIEAFGRSYFVTGMVSIATGLTEISAHVDVISSFKEQIRENRAIIARQESKWNLYLNDGAFKTYQDPMVMTAPFPSGFSTYEFVLAVAGS